MNYDRLATMKVVELRQIVTNIHTEYNSMTNSRISRKEIRRMPKARLLYIMCRYWAEIDTEINHRRMIEDIKHREALLTRSVRVNPELTINTLQGTYVLTIRKEE